MAQQLEDQRRHTEAASASTSHATAVAKHASTEEPNSLRAQLRELESSPQFQRPRADRVPVASPIPLASSFDHVARGGATTSLSMSQLQSSPPSMLRPPPNDASAALHATPSRYDPSSNSSTLHAPSADPGHVASATVSALHHQLSDFNASLHEFQHALLASRHKLDQERTEALGNMDHSIGTLEESLELETRNCDTSVQSMKKYAESVLESWTVAHHDPWSSDLSQLEEMTMRLLDRVQWLERESDSDRALAQSMFDDMDLRTTDALGEVRQVFAQHVDEKQQHGHQRALLKMDALEQKMKHLVQRNAKNNLELAHELDRQVRALTEGRNEMSVTCTYTARAAMSHPSRSLARSLTLLSYACACVLSVRSVEHAIVDDITDVRHALFDTTGSRMACDEELRNAFRFATTKLQKGLMLLRQ
jgi:hypothetical protein